jgi:hypothetical protein
VLTLLAVLACISVTSEAQVRSAFTASSATQVSAEITSGKLNPVQTRPGDQVTLKLNEDVRSNGDVVLKKGSTITGVVRSVKRAEGKVESKQAQSMIEIDWIAPAAQETTDRRLSITLQTVSYINPLYGHGQEEAEYDGSFAMRTDARPASSRSADGLLGGATRTAVAATTSTISSSTTVVTTPRRSNAALLSMPSVIAADAGTMSAFESGFGMSSTNGQLFMVGRGELITAGGSKQSLHVFSRLNNDTVLTSNSSNFELSSGAQMQLLVGVQRN